MQKKILLAFVLSCMSQVVFAKETLVFAIDVIRHGDRSSIQTIPTAPHEWEHGLGQLSREGIEQEHQLGMALHKNYMETNSLLPLHYSPQTMYVISSDIDRTLMSAESLLAGLYPGDVETPLAFQPIPIHTVPLAQEKLLICDNDAKKFNALLNQYVETQPDWKQKTKELAPKFSEWNRLLGTHITRLRDIPLVSDALYIYKLHHIAWPQGLTEEEGDAIISAGEWVILKEYTTKAVGDCRPLLPLIGRYIKDASQQKSPLKYVLFSAHDSTIAGLMGAMQAPLAAWPHYASHLNYALYQDDNGSYTVKVMLNDEPAVIPACHQSNSCPLDVFLEMTQK